MTAQVLPLTQLHVRRPFPARLGPKGTLVYKLVTTTDHKVIGIMYCVACFVFVFVGGLMALLMRTELAVPGLQFLSNEQYNQLFTMRGTVMLLFYATPIVFGFANLMLPLQIGARDVARPKRGAMSKTRSPARAPRWATSSACRNGSSTQPISMPMRRSAQRSSPTSPWSCSRSSPPWYGPTCGSKSKSPRPFDHRITVGRRMTARRSHFWKDLP
jgi:hypothetical protein